MKKTLLFASLLLSSVVLFACTSESKQAKNESNTVKISKTKNNSQEESEKTSDLDFKTLNKLADNTKSTDEVYVTGKITVKKGGDIEPGLYDLQITGGSGNIMGERASTYAGMYINWLGAANNDNQTGYPSTIRILLLEGDILEFTDISKIKLSEAQKPESNTNETGIGNYIVGRDILPGTYKLSSNMTMDSEFSNLGWTLGIYTPKTNEERSQTYNPSNQDVVVKLKKGDILTTTFDNTQYETSSDTAKLIFSSVE